MDTIWQTSRIEAKLRKSTYRKKRQRDYDMKMDILGEEEA